MNKKEDAARLVMIQEAELHTMGLDNWRQCFIDKGYEWLIEMAENEINYTHPEFDPNMLGLDATCAGRLMDIIIFLNKENSL